MSANSRGAAERSAREGLLLATAAAMLWGTVGVASKLLPDGVTLSSFHLGFARLAIAAPLLVLFGVLVLGRALWAIPARAWPWVATVGLLAACYQFSLFVSVEQLRVAKTALLTVCLPPVLIAGASALIAHRRPSAWTTGALLLALGGLTLVGGGSGGPGAVPGAAPLLGLAMATLAAMAFAALSALARMLAGRIHPLQAVRFGFAVGAVLLAPIVVLSGRAEPGVVAGAASTAQIVLILLYVGAVPTALAYICYFYGMQRSRSATSGIAATLVEPAVAVLLAAGLLGEYLSPTAWFGVACLPFAAIALGLEGNRLIPASLHFIPVAPSQLRASDEALLRRADESATPVAREPKTATACRPATGR
jgi:drug/metabolite transporter, DME family